MVDIRIGEKTRREPLRLWPGVLIVLLQWLTRFGLPVIAPDVGGFAVLSGPVGALAVRVRETSPVLAGSSSTAELRGPIRSYM